MSPLRRTLLGVALSTLLSSPLTAQGRWDGPADGCELNAGHYLLSGATLYLKQATESNFPDQREGRLAEAHRVLIEALTEAGQENNAAAWYYLGRYYVMKADPAGADSAFRQAQELAPDCTDDISTYRSRVAVMPLNDALRTWGEGKVDSAGYFFALAARLAPEDAEVPLYTAIMYSSQNELDSAAKYVAIGQEAAESDTAHADRLKQALRELARGYETKAYENQAILTAPQTRQSRDSVSELIDTDSTRLAAMVGRVAEIREAGRRLDDASRQAFEQESTAVATKIDRMRAAHDSLAERATTDSTAVATSLDPAIESYETYLAAYPDDVTASLSLARMFSITGRGDELNALVELVVELETDDRLALVTGGQSLYAEGQHLAAARLLEKALTLNPFDRNALMILGNTYYALEDADHLRATAERLMGVDPLNARSVRVMALVFALEGNRDSTIHYLGLADGGIQWNVTVNQFMARDEITSLAGSIRNLTREPLPPTTIVFEFLDAEGVVLFSAQVEVPALDARGRESISVRRQEGGAVAWRYHRQQ